MNHPQGSEPAHLSTRPRHRLGVWQAIAAIVGVASLLAGLIFMTKPQAFQKVTPAASVRGIAAHLDGHREFSEWLRDWTAVDPYLRAGEFQPTGSETLIPATVARAAADDFRVPSHAARFITSPGGLGAADIMAGFGQADASVLVSRHGDEPIEIARRDRPGYFQAGLWLDDSVLVVLGTSAERRDSGEPFCVASSGGSPTCLYRLTIDVFDFATKRHDAYRSEKHGLAVDPFREELRRRYEASLTADERLVAALRDKGLTAETVSGRLATVLADGFELVAAVTTASVVPETETEAAPSSSVLVPAQASIVDERGVALDLAALHMGDSVIVVGYRNSTGRLVASRVKVTSAPSL